LNWIWESLLFLFFSVITSTRPALSFLCHTKLAFLKPHQLKEHHCLCACVCKEKGEKGERGRGEEEERGRGGEKGEEGERGRGGEGERERRGRISRA
jgi:hypothetical protein